jgi:hypothetical protein
MQGCSFLDDQRLARYLCFSHGLGFEGSPQVVFDINNVSFQHGDFRLAQGYRVPGDLKFGF